MLHFKRFEIVIITVIVTIVITVVVVAVAAAAVAINKMSIFVFNPYVLSCRGYK